MFQTVQHGRHSVRSRNSLSFQLARYLACGAVWLAMSVGMAAAQTAGNDPLNMADAVRAAVRTHPSVRGAGESVQQATAGVDAARAGYKPQISGGVENRFSLHKNNGADSRGTYTARLTVSQMVYDFGKVDGAVDKAKADVRASAAQVEFATDEVGLNTAQAWLDAYLQQALVQIAREQLAAVMSITELVTERATKGATTRSDVQQASSRVEAVRSQLLGAEAEALRASLALMHLTGRTAPVAIIGEIPPILKGAACRDAGEADMPAVRMAIARRDEARAELEIAKAQRLPTVTLDGSVGYGLTDSSRLPGEQRTTGQVGVNVSMPLYQGGRAQAQERGAIHQLRAYEDAVQQARLQSRQGFADAKAQVDGWARRAPVLQTRVDSINATRGLYRQQYLNLGTRSLIDLLNAEQEYHGARIEQSQGIHAQYRLAVQCLYYSDRLRSAFGLEDAQPNAGTTISQGGRQ